MRKKILLLISFILIFVVASLIITYSYMNREITTSMNDIVKSVETKDNTSNKVSIS